MKLRGQISLELKPNLQTSVRHASNIIGRNREATYEYDGEAKKFMDKT